MWYFPSSMGQEAMTFQKKLLLALGDKTAKLAKSSEITVQKNCLSRSDNQAVGVPNFLKGKAAFSH
jgi:hypothetical protein